MTIKKIILALTLVFILIFLSSNVFSQIDTGKLPKGLQKIIEYNNEQADYYLKNLSIVIAFIAGILSIMLPCSLGILPAFFAVTFKEKKDITKMTLAFFLGFMPVFVVFGLIATFLGTTISDLQNNNRLVIIIAGILLIFFGLMVMFGKGFSFIKVKNEFRKDFIGVIITGVIFALGWTACLGPIVVGILLIASTFGNYIYSGVLMFFYSLGLFVPIFLISFLFDKYNLAENKFIKGKVFEVKFFGKKFLFHSTNLISALLLIFLGILFIFFGGTKLINSIATADLTIFIYSLQEKLISIKFINIIGALIMLIFIFVMWKFLRKKNV